MFCYTTPTKDVADTFTTSGTAGTEIDALFIKPGARNIVVTGVLATGRGAGLSALSGINVRLKRWGTTASSSGTAVTPHPSDPGAQAATATAAAASAGVTSGTGGPTVVASFGCGAAGPGAWTARDIDAGKVVQGSATQSLDAFVVSGTASLSYDIAAEHYE